ncbi:MAG: type I methionyl aminopeptidase [Candidatus Marinimicrobia bacterium]|nr:type I methionyl aminopeptidase [Candidatus Neomarinimicrobiota bacterium]
MIYIRSKDEIHKIWESNKIVYETLQMLGKEIKPGVKTKRLDKLAEEFIHNKGGRPAFKGYNGYPATICTSIDEQVVHGIPSNRELRDGEILSIDVGAEKNGYYGDSAYTYAVGEVEPIKKKLMNITQESLYKGIAMANPGNRLSDIGNAVQTHVENHGFSVVRVLVGHGIGRELHEHPEVPNYGEPGKGPTLKAGMCIAIEPMVNVGTYNVFTLDDGWTVVTADKKPSAHYEHTITITEDGPLILSNGK